MTSRIRSVLTGLHVVQSLASEGRSRTTETLSETFSGQPSTGKGSSAWPSPPGTAPHTSSLATPGDGGDRSVGDGPYDGSVPPPSASPLVSFRAGGPSSSAGPSTSATAQSPSAQTPPLSPLLGPQNLPFDMILRALSEPSHASSGSSSSDSEGSDVASISSFASSESESSASDSDLPPAAVEPGPQADRCDGECRRRGPRKKLPGEPRRGSGAWYRFHRECVIHPGSDVTVMQACYFVATLKSQHKVTDVVIDQICTLIHHVLLPKGNLFPPSLHLLRAVAGAPDAATLARHVCDSCWEVFPPMPPGVDFGAGQRAAPDPAAAPGPAPPNAPQVPLPAPAGADVPAAPGDPAPQLLPGNPPPPQQPEVPPGPDAAAGGGDLRHCVSCGNARFQPTRSPVPRPRRQAYYFGEQETVEDLVTRPGMIQRILKDRKDLWDDPASFWGSPAGRMLNERCGGLFTPVDDPTVVPEEIAVAFTLGASPNASLVLPPRPPLCAAAVITPHVPVSCIQ